MALFKKQKLEAFEMMKNSLVEAVTKEVGQKLIEASKKNQEELQKKLFARLEDWDKSIKERVKEIIKEEYGKSHE